VDVGDLGQPFRAPGESLGRFAVVAGVVPDCFLRVRPSMYLSAVRHEARATASESWASINAAHSKHLTFTDSPDKSIYLIRTLPQITGTSQLPHPAII